MARTEVFIKVVIYHDTPKTKHVGLDVWCKGLKVGQKTKQD